jgi:hypothetical protein
MHVDGEAMSDYPWDLACVEHGMVVKGRDEVDSADGTTLNDGKGFKSLWGRGRRCYVYNI